MVPQIIFQPKNYSQIMIEDIENIIFNEKQIVTDAAENWDRFWTEQLKYQPKNNVSRFKHFLARGAGLELSFRIVKKELSSSGKNVILEAGSGTGRLSMKLLDKAGQLVLLDTSVSALEITRKFAGNSLDSPIFLNASIFDLPLTNDSCDFVFNVGVIDNFGPQYRLKAVKEMVRVVKKGGKVVIVTNDARGFIHESAMKYTIRKNRWNFGFKDAIYSLKEMEEELAGCKIGEYSRGFISQFEFLRYFISQNRLCQQIFYRIFCAVSFPLSFLNIFPGQYRVTVIYKI